MERERETDLQITISLSRKVVLFSVAKICFFIFNKNCAICVYLHGFSNKCFASNFVLLSRVFFFSLSGKLFCI